MHLRGSLRMLTMAVSSDQVPKGIGPGQSGQLCRELEFAAVTSLLTLDSEGALATGVSLSTNAAILQRSARAATQFKQQVYDALASGLPLSVSVRELGEGTDAHTAFSAVCDVLRLASNDAGVVAPRTELVIATRALAPQAAWVLRRARLGPGTVYLLPDEFSMLPGSACGDRRADDRYWSELQHMQNGGRVRAAWSHAVYSQCALLSSEVADTIQPEIGLQTPAGSAWLPMRLDLSRFADSRGALRESALERALRHSVDIGELLHDNVRWPTAQLRHDAWLNRRLAIELTGFGNLVARRAQDPQCFASLESLLELLRWIEDILRQQSRATARAAGHLPAFEQSDPSRELPRGQIRKSWRRRWRAAVESSGIRHRNLIVLSPWSVFPERQPADYRYADLLPLLSFAHACAFPAPPSVSHWNVSKFKCFHRRVWAVLQKRGASRQIAEGP